MDYSPYADPSLHADGSFEYLLAGLERELDDGLARLKAADGGDDDHVAWYRKHFHDYVQMLRQAVDQAGPAGHHVAVYAWQVAFLARIWPMLKQQRVSDSARDNIGSENKTRREGAQEQKRRCLEIAEAMTRPTAAIVRGRYRLNFPTTPTPAVRTIRRYLASR